MESWRKVWRDGLAMHLSTPALEALATALEEDSKKLIQGATTIPPPLQCVQDWPAEAGCVIGFCGIIDKGGFGKATVGEVEEMFAQTCFAIDHDLGEPAAWRWFLNLADETPRDEMRSLLLAEVKRTLANRGIDLLSNGAVYVDVAPIQGVDQ